MPSQCFRDTPIDVKEIVINEILADIIDAPAFAPTP